MREQTGEHVAAIERRNRNQVEERQQQIDDDERHTDLCRRAHRLPGPRAATGGRLRQRPACSRLLMGPAAATNMKSCGRGAAG